ncbi:2Fe-2S iron-sulfur cluster-binding protein [Pendulispora albinea]|uniref:2Fe-2S iron-sulfur cluster-binding protein n=1 Tax=Pendulispora albinea TaxID=2741071 RepID=A0ABZ2M2V9_9BACT
MAGRLAPLSNPIHVTFDGVEIPAAPGEPLAVSLVGAGHLALARSPKFHRPRGPSCLRGACDGCLARVDGAPNVMTCMVGACDKMEIKSQNTLGTREVDLLQMTDWFFPEGINHHELFAGVFGLDKIMMAFARRVAGLGKLPSEVAPARPARRRSADVVVVGSGPSGMLVATELAARGRTVEVLDDAVRPGGSTHAFLGIDGWRAIRERFEAACSSPKPKNGSARHETATHVRLRYATTAAGIFKDDLLVVGPEGAEIVDARAVILAPGAHDGVLAFEGNDLPGVMSARAALGFLAHGVTVGYRVAVVVTEGGGPFGEIYARAMKAMAPNDVSVTVVHGEPEAAIGVAGVKEVTLRKGESTKSLRADALLVDAPRSPAYELVAQAGADLEHRAYGFVPRTNGGHIRDRFWVIGEAAGTALEEAALREEAMNVAARI